MNGIEAKIDGLEVKIEDLKKDMEVLKGGLTRLLQEMFPNGREVEMELRMRTKEMLVMIPYTLTLD